MFESEKCQALEEDIPDTPSSTAIMDVIAPRRRTSTIILLGLFNQGTNIAGSISSVNAATARLYVEKVSGLF